MANKIIVVTGSREGVGKTTLAANIAARYSQIRHQPVVLVDADMLCRGETGQMAGATSSSTVLQILDQLATKQLTLALLRSRIAMNRLGIGTIQLASDPREVERLTSEQWAYFLQTVNQAYDIVIDMEISNPLRLVSIDLADAVIWTLLPNALCVRSTIQQFDLLLNQKVSFERFVMAVNQMGLPNAMTLEAMAQALGRYGRPMETLPFDAGILQLLNSGRPVLLESARAPFLQALMPLLDKITRFRRVSGNGFSPGSAVPGAAPAARGSGTVTMLQSNVVDKMLDEKRKRWNHSKQAIHRQLVDELNIRRIDLDTKGDLAKERQLRTNVESTVNALISKENDLTLNREDRERLVKELVDEALGLGPLEELLEDPSITEIMVNRFDQVYVERRGKIFLSDKRFIDNNHVVQVIRRIIAPLGRRIDESVPMVDARLKDGSRVNAIIPPLAVQGPSITIRRFPDKAFTSEDLIRMSAISKDMIDFLRVCVQTKKNIVISGGTGTGKTTILNLLSGFIPNDDRIVTVEDTAELRLQQEHVVRLEARPPNIEGLGQVTIRDLVKNSLRMRPDRIVVGECRGGEALDMLQAMNTGHDGSLTTIHANSSRDCFTRLETLCLMAGMDLPVWALREQIRSAVHIVVQLSRLQDGSRRVTSITEIIGRDEEAIRTQDLFQFVQDSVDDKGHVHGHHEACGNLPKFLPELKSKGLLLDQKIFEAKPQ